MFPTVMQFATHVSEIAELFDIRLSCFKQNFKNE